MDEPKPGPDEPFDDDVYVRGFWQQHRHLLRSGDAAADAAAALGWADDGIDTAMRDHDAESAVSLLWRLLAAPDADPQIVAYGPLRTLLAVRGPEVADDIADLCARLPEWRTAMSHVELTPEQTARIPQLAPYLKPA